MNGIEVYLDKVIEGDCLAILPGIPDRSIHLILCDLPYGTTVIAWDKVIDLERLWKAKNNHCAGTKTFVFFTMASLLTTPSYKEEKLPSPKPVKSNVSRTARGILNPCHL